MKRLPAALLSAAMRLQKKVSFDNSGTMLLTDENGRETEYIKDCYTYEQ